MWNYTSFSGDCSYEVVPQEIISLQSYCLLASIFRISLLLLLLFSRFVTSNSWPHGLQHARFCYPSPSPRVHSNSCPSSQWCHPTVSSSVIPFSSCLQSFPAAGSFPVSQFFASGGQNNGAWASASVLPMSVQWFPLGLTGLISLQSKGLSSQCHLGSPKRGLGYI